MHFVMNLTLKKWEKVHNEKLWPLTLINSVPLCLSLSLRVSLPHIPEQSLPLTLVLSVLQLPLKGDALTVGCHAIRNGGGSEGVALLRVDKLAHRRQLVHAVHFVQRWGAVTV